MEERVRDNVHREISFYSKSILEIDRGKGCNYRLASAAKMRARKGENGLTGQANKLYFFYFSNSKPITKFWF